MHPKNAALGDPGAVRRRGLPTILLLIALAATVSSCKRPAEPQTPVGPTLGFALRGVVTETASAGQDSIGAVLVEITSGDKAGTSTTTDASGRFEFLGVTGTFNLRFSKDGYVATGRTVTVAADVFLTITLDRDDSDEPGKTYTLSGTVMRKQGSGGPIAGALVEVLDGDRAGDSATTDGSGAYSIPGLSGELTVKASRDGYEDLEKTVEMTEDVTLMFSMITPPQVSMCLDLDDEELHITNDDSVNELILTGWKIWELTDGNNFTFVEDRECRASMNGFTLAPGGTVIITSGDDPEHDPPTYIAGWCDFVWDNDGDSARLVNPDTGVVLEVEGRTDCGG